MNAHHEMEELLTLVRGISTRLDAPTARRLEVQAETAMKTTLDLSLSWSSLVEQVEELYSEQTRNLDLHESLVAQLEAVYADREEEQATLTNLVAQLESCYADRESDPSQEKGKVCHS